MANLYELAAEYAKLQEGCYEGEIDARQLEDLLQEVDEAKGGLRDKVDKIARLIRNLEADGEKVQNEERRLAKRRKSFNNNAQRLRKWVRDTMDILDVVSIKTELHTVSLGKASEKVVVEDPKKVPEEYRKKPEIQVDKAKVMKTYRDNGEIVEGCEIQEGERSLTIR